MTRGRSILLLLLAVFVGSQCAPPVIAQEEEDLTVGLKEIRQSYDRARQFSDDLDFPNAVAELNSLIDPRRGALPSERSLEQIRILSVAYELRARAYFNLGNLESAEADFEALLTLAPSFRIDRRSLSPKVVGLFDEVRNRLVGLLVLQIDPRGARVTIDGEPADPDALADLAMLDGTHELRVEEDGYEPHSETLHARVGTELRINIRLRPNRRILEFITEPAGATVSLDGRPVGTTSGTATVEVEALAERFDFDPANASAPFPVPLVTAGEHQVTFERECYQSRTLKVKVVLDVDRNTPLRLAPVVLQKAPTELRITSIPEGSDVLIDGEKKGTTPMTVTGLCTGERQIAVVKHGVGRWSERIRLTSSGANTLDVRLRPTLLYAGTFRMDEWGRVIWSNEDGILLNRFGEGLTTLNMVRSEEVLEETREAIIKWMISDPTATRAGTLVPPNILKKAATRAGADLLLAGLSTEDDPEQMTTLALYSALHPAPDLIRLAIDETDPVHDFVRRLDRAPASTGAWWGMGLADTMLGIGEREGGAAHGGWPVVVRVLPGSPAATAGLRVGDRVQMVESQSVEGVATVRKAFAAGTARPAGRMAPVVLTVQGPEGQRTVRLTPVESPMLIPLTDPDLLYNRALAEFRLRARAADDELDKGVAYLNLGIAMMHFRAYDKAQSQGFDRASLPEGSGISRGTVAYYRGLCALRRGDPRAARTAFEAAAASTASTLESGDGPSAAAAARRLLLAMQ